MNKWIRRILWTLASLVGVAVGGFALLVLLYKPPIEVAKGFDPSCQPSDFACATWVTFRRSHPFPYQAIAAKNLAAGMIVVVVSEPPPSVDAASLDRLVKAAFGDSTNVQRKRWMIGVDGWLEDLVLTIDRPAGDDVTVKSMVRDGTSILCTALFGTTYGSEIEEIADLRAGDAKLDVAAYHATPKELGEWMRDPSLTWQDVRGEGKNSQWTELANERAVGAYVSSDASLVMLTFPTKFVASSVTESKALERLRVPFREFAVASEGIVGGLWTNSGQLALLARARTTAQQAAPALRFETFAALMAAARNTEELAQSYERTQPFAGKLSKGPYEFHDWAPIYLSPQLVDTEFGALLNVTDQMLKSWSSAGTVEYLYFDYSKPNRFPFGEQPLSDIILKETGETTLLFNWNTAGSTVIVRDDGQSLMTSAGSGSLPVTYGAGGKTAAQGGADLYGYEDKAYDYFSSLRDPNLQRVVQYTVMYQLLRAAAKEGAGPTTKPESMQVDASSKSATAARMELIKATQRFLHEFSAKPAAFEPKEASDALQRFMSDHSSIGEERLAAMLADRNSEHAIHFLKEISDSLSGLQQALVAQGEVLEKKIDAYNARLTLAQQRALEGKDPGVTESQISVEKAEIEAEKSLLEADAGKLDAQLSHNPLMDAMTALSKLVQNTQDLEGVRSSYVRAFEHEPRGSIRTPSIVVSWHSKDTLRHVGGHNLNSRALRFERAADVAGMEVKQEADGTTLFRYNPSKADAVESAAPKLARALEHRGEHDLDKLQELMNNAAASRSRADALLLSKATPKAEPLPVFAKIGKRIYTAKTDFVEDLRAMAGQNDCCIFVVHDANRSAFVAEANLKPPPVATVYEVYDTPSLMSHLKSFGENTAARRNAKAAIFIDEPDGFVDSVVRTMRDSGDAGNTGLSAGTSGTSGREGPPRPPDGRSTLFAQPDFDGKPSWLRTLIEPMESVRQKFIGGMARSISPAEWKSAKVEDMSREALDSHLTALKWDQGRDGVPVGVRVTLNDSLADRGRDMTVIAGIGDANAASSAAVLKSASVNATEEAADRSASAGQYLLTIKARLNRLDDRQLRRLVLVAQSGDTKMYFTRLEMPEVTSRLHGRRAAA